MADVKGRATERPWFISRDPRPDMEWNNHIASAANPHLEICSMFHTNELDGNETGEANAELIVRAVNSHDSLVKALVDLAITSRAALRQCEPGIGVKTRAAAGNAYERAYDLVGGEIDAALASLNPGGDDAG
jgi:hypothetical protein